MFQSPLRIKIEPFSSVIISKSSTNKNREVFLQAALHNILEKKKKEKKILLTLRHEKVRDKIKKGKEKERKRKEKSCPFYNIFLNFFLRHEKKISANYSLRFERMLMTHFCLSQSFNF
jgi:hypothetical protein